MKISKHTRFISLLLAVIMVLSTAAIFAEVEDPSTGDGADVNQIVTEEDEILDEVADVVEVVETEGEAPAENGLPTVKLDKTEISVKAGASYTLKASATDASGTAVVDPVLTWFSSNTAVATVTNGVVKGVKAGSAEITVNYEGAEAKCKVTVTAAGEPISQVAPTISKWKKKYDSGDLEGKKDNGYILSWNHSDKSGVDAYQVLRRKGSNGKWKVIKTVKVNASHSLLVLVPKGTYYYAVRPVQYKADNKTIAKYGKTSASKKAKISGVITSTSGIDWYGVAKKKATIYKKGTGSAKVTKVKKGTKMSAIGRYPTKVKKYHYAQRVKVTYKVGKKTITGWIKWGDLKGGVKASTVVKKDYSRSLKEQFVNETWNKKHKDIPLKKSPDGLLVWVCLHTQRAYTFKWSDGKWVLKHTDRVTTGRYSQPTRSTEKAGELFTITTKVPGKVMMVQEDGRVYYFTTVSYIGRKAGQKGSVSFHTGTWWENGAVRAQIKSNGQPGTFGCIRMTVAGARYMYNTTNTMKTAILITMED